MKEGGRNKPPIAPVRFWRNHGRKIIYAALLYFLTKWAVNNTFIAEIDPMMFVQIGMALLMQIGQVAMYFGFFFWMLGGRIRTKLYLPGDLQYTWDDYVGNEAVRDRLKLIVDMLMVRKGLAKKLGGVHPTHTALVGPPGTGKCVASDTLINTGAGLVPISILGNAPAGHIESTTLIIDTPVGARIANQFYNGGISDTICVTTDRGFSIECTPEHPLLTISETGEKIWRRADELRHSDYVGIMVGEHICNSAVDPLGPDSLDAYAMGILVGDGTLGNRKHQPGGIMFTSADEEIINCMQKWAEKHGLDVKSRGKNTPMQYIINSIRLFDKLEQWNLPACISKHKFIPSTILGGRKDLQRAFLRGLFDADGTSSKRDGYVSFSTASKRLAREVQILLLSFGIVTRIRSKKSPGTWPGSEHRLFTSYNVALGGVGSVHFYDTIGFGLARKQIRKNSLPAERFDFTDVLPNQGERMLAIINATPRKQRAPKKKGEHFRHCIAGKHNFTRATAAAFLKYYDCPEIKHLLDSPILWDKIVDLEPGQTSVFDLTVPEEHCFIANGFVSHNSYAATIIASEAQVPVLSVEASSLLGTFIGIGPLKTWNLFRKINKLARIWDAAILYIDEIDAWGSGRGGAAGGGTWSLMGGNMGGQILSTFLACLSGLNEPSGMKHRFRRFLKDFLGIPYVWQAPNTFVLVATNIGLERLDQALFRAGRIGQHIEIGLPSKADIVNLCRYYLLERKYEYGVIGVPCDDTCIPERMARIAAGCSQADIAEGFNDAKRLAYKVNEERITFAHWMQAIMESRAGLKQPLPLTERDTELIAIHEGGHALAAIALGQEVVVATIERYGKTGLGHIRHMPVEEHVLSTAEDIEKSLLISLSSLAAENVLGQRTPGTAVDLDNVKKLIILLMSQGIIGSPLYVKMPKESGGQTVGAALPIAELTEEGHALAARYYNHRLAEAEALMENHKGHLRKLADLLKEEKTIYYEQVIETVGDLWNAHTLTPFIAENKEK